MAEPLRPKSALVGALAVMVVGGLLAAPPTGGARLRLSHARTVALRGALPQVQQVAALSEGDLAVLSDGSDGGSPTLQTFTRRGVLKRTLAGKGSPAALGRVTSVQVAGGAVWASAFLPPEVAEFRGGHLAWAKVLPAPLMTAYALALDPARGLAYVSGLVRPGPGAQLVHRFTFPAFQIKGSALPTSPLVVRDGADVAQWVPMAVGLRGTVWAVDAPALTLYAIRASGNVDAYPIRSRLAHPPGPLDQMAGAAAERRWWTQAYWPAGVFAAKGRIIVCVRRPRGAGYLLEVLIASGRQVGVDLPTPDRLVGVSGDGSLIFARDGQPPALLRGRIVGAR